MHFKGSDGCTNSKRFKVDLGLLDHEGAEDLVVDCHVLPGAQVGAGSQIQG